MVRFADNAQVDFVVIGGGGAGAIVAKELSTAGLQVVILEQGPYLHEGDFEHDELKFKDIFDPPGIGREVLTRDHALQPDTFRKTDKEKAVVVPFIEYGRCIGGGTVHFTGNYWRFHEIDFHERSKWGELPGTGLAD
jgi:choline dehydrogenase-like flavoprotein